MRLRLAPVALGLLTAAALPAALLAEDATQPARAAAEALELLEQRRPSDATAPAALALADAWLLRGDWLPASELLQQALELAAELAQEEVAQAARSRLAAVDRLCLRPSAGRKRWRAARVLTPARVNLRKPVGVAARGDGDLIVVDQAGDLVYLIPAGGGAAETLRAPRARRPAWGPDGEVLITDRDGVTRRLRGGSGVPQRPPGAGQAIDVARDTAGRWLMLESEPLVVRVDAGAPRETRIELPPSSRPEALTSDPLGNLYVLDAAPRSILVLDRLGGRLDRLGPTLPGGVELRRPEDIAADGSGRLYIADRRVGLVVLE